MNPIALQRQLHHRLGQLGLAGGLGLGLLLLAVLALPWLHAKEQEVDALAAKRLALQQQLASKNSLPVRSALSRQEQLRVFYQGFAPVGELPVALKRIYHAAQGHGLLLDSGEYTRLAGNGERLVRWRVTLPVQGSFVQILGFMDQVMQQDKTVALEGASFKREKVDDASMEARLSFVLLLDGQP